MHTNNTATKQETATSIEPDFAEWNRLGDELRSRDPERYARVVEFLQMTIEAEHTRG